MRAFRVWFAFVLALLALTPVAARRAVTMTEWTSSPQLTLPSATDGTSVTPNGSSDVFSAWTQMSASVSSDIVITGLTAKWPGTACGNLGERLIFELGTGAAASETAFVTGLRECQDGANNVYLLFAVPVKVSSGSRLSVRMRKNSTDTGAWRFAITYYALPFTGSITYTSTASATAVFGSASITPAASSYANSAWAEATTAANNSSATVYGGALSINYNGSQTCASGVQGEFAIGTGGSGAETEQTYWHYIQATGAMAQPSYLRPVLSVAASTRVAFRIRKSGTSNAACAFRVIRQAVGSDDVTGISTTQGQTWVPTAANGTTVTSGTTSWANAASWTEFIASTGTAVAVTGIYLDCSTTSGEYEVEIGTGASSSEVPAGATRVACNSARAPSVYPIYPAVNIATSTRVSVRVRSSVNAATATTVSLGYIASPSFKARGDAAPAAAPAAANGVTLTPSSSSWGDSAYQQLIASTSERDLLTSITYNTAGSTAEMEFDLATGGAGSEAVLTTLRSATMAPVAFIGYVRLDLQVPTLVEAGQRIAIRMRKGNTNTTGWTRVALNYVPAEPGFAVLSVPVPFILSQTFQDMRRLAGWPRESKVMATVK